MSRNNSELEKKLWNAADRLRANSNLTSAEYSMPVLGLIFLKFVDNKFNQVHETLTKKMGVSGRKRDLTPDDYQAEGVMYLTEKARYSYLLSLPEGENIGSAINQAMKDVEESNADLKGVLPKTYTRLSDQTLIALLKAFSEIPQDIEGDVFGKIYEYFLGNFAMTEGRGGGEFFTPTSIVKLIVETIEPYKGRVYDPASGSGGMFVQSANFVKEHQARPETDMVAYGQEKTLTSVKLAKMNLAVHGLSGDIRQGNTFYEDVHSSVGKFDYVMANPPFNVKQVDKEKIKNDPRLVYGIPNTDNANYLWIQYFYSALNKHGRAGFVMANSASDAGNSEKELRKKLLEDNAVDVMIAVGPNFFYTVTLACTLWFLDKDKNNTNRKDKVLFIDARNIYYQIDRAHREFTPEQIQKIAGVVRAYRGEKGADKYEDVQGFCKVATLEEIKKQDYSLNPGRYVGTAEADDDGEDFSVKVKELTEEFKTLTDEAHDLEEKILANVSKLN